MKNALIKIETKIDSIFHKNYWDISVYSHNGIVFDRVIDENKIEETCKRLLSTLMEIERKYPESETFTDEQILCVLCRMNTKICKVTNIKI